MRFLSRQYIPLAMLILISSCIVCVYAGSVSPETGPNSIFKNSGSLTENRADNETLEGSLRSALVKMMLAILMVVGLGAATIYASKKVLPKLAHSQGKKIKIIETVHLGSRKTIHLLQVADRQILIGSTHDRITKLADIFSEKDFPLSSSCDSGVDE